jgi:signal transduction histidine kinase
VLNPNAVFFKEFKVMVGYANNMLHTISDQKTSLKELNTHLEDKVKEKTQDLENILDAQKEFLRYTVHETNTPLSVILTSLELYEMNHEKDKHLSKVEAAAKNIFNIYDDLSYLVKKDQVEYHRVAINIEQFVNSRIDFFTEVALLSKVKFSYISEVKELFIYFNETKLQRIVDNTLTNAIKYTYQNEIVDVNLKHSGLHVSFSVGSHSQAIKDEDRIFDEYYREDTKAANGIQGFGIGLRLVKNICDEEGVSISLESNTQKNIFTYGFKAMGK